MKKGYLLLILLLASVCYGIENDRYAIMPGGVAGEVQVGGHFSQSVLIENRQSGSLNLDFKLAGNISDMGVLSLASAEVGTGENKTLTLNVFGEEIEQKGNETIEYPVNMRGDIKITGDAEESIPVDIVLFDRPEPDSGSLVVTLKPLQNKVTIGKHLRYVVDLENILVSREFNVRLHHKFITLQSDINKTQGTVMFSDAEVNETLLLSEDNLTFKSTFSLPKEYHIGKEFVPGEY
ncbi:hypothetical protein GF323_01515, partial [Candidatus Woesearchaeota archaeon]|nr:hypothetical protein [Candidatus Woesearchaeota archaeon]